MVTIENIVTAVDLELRNAMARHAPMHSPHEGISVIREEFEELWKHVMEDTGRLPEARSEALRIAAMACRYVFDLCVGPRPDCDRCELEAASPERFRCADHSARPA